MGKILLLHITILYCFSAFSQKGPKPGDIYREYAVNLRTGDNWRVTDPGATHPGAAAFLPNPVLNITIDDLDKAVRAEVLMDIWGGHVGTSGKNFRFNGHDWIGILPVSTIPYAPYCYLSQYNTIIDLPLEYLVEGVNTFEGTSAGQVCGDFGWGQWGWYVMMVRVYYSSDKPHTEGQIIFPSRGDTLGDDPLIQCLTADTASVSQIQFLGKYFGYDENGDGIYRDWHRAYHGPEISGHLGTRSGTPFQVQWNTRYVPDQEPGSVSFMARIQDTSGIWYVTETVDSLNLIRPDTLSVRLLRPMSIPQNFVVRAGNTKQCFIDIDSLDNIMEARLFHRTWNAADNEAAGGSITRPLRVNESPYYCKGKHHFFALSAPGIAVGDLHTGLNKIAYTSDTHHHGIEVLWPGPCFILRYVRNGQRVADPVFTPPDSTFFQGILTPTIESATGGSTILYTTDSRDPNFHDPRYIPGLIQVKSDIVLKARAFKSDLYESEVTTATYLVGHTGIETNTTQGILIFPNPAGNYVRLAIPERFTGGHFRITDTSGRLVHSGRSEEGKIRTGHLEEGLYLLRYLYGDHEFSGRLIIKR